MSVNALGYRGPLLSATRAPGVERVVVLGDSIGFGLEADDGQTFAALLGQAPGREVANLSVQGYGTDQETLRFEDAGPQLRPDAVVLALCVANDFADVALDRFLYDGRHPKPYFTLEANQLRLHDAHLRLGAAARTGQWLGARSLLYRRLLGLAAPASTGDDQHWMRIVEEMEPRWAQNVAIVSRLVRRIAAASQASGARFLVAAFPYRRSWDEGGSRELEALAGWLAAAGIPLLDLRPVFAASGQGFEALSVDKLGHLSPAGHRLAAAAIGDALSRAPGPEPDPASSR